MALMAGPPTVSIVTLGCRLNQGESDRLARDFRARGYEWRDEGQAADVLVINTCTVTHVADRKSRQLMRRARRLNPDGLLVVTGCYPSVAEVEVSALALADLVVPNSGKPTLPALADGLLRQRRGHALPGCTEAAAGLAAPSPPERARVYVKVQDGCNDRCTYCIIPRARGRSRSRPPAEVVREVRGWCAEGYPEVTLTGITMNVYGRDLPEAEQPIDLGRLVARLLDETPVPRLGLSSLEPNRFDPAWLGLWQDPRLVRHLHLALQSGSDAVLRGMKRRYRARHYQAVVAAARAAMPDCSITTDVIVGFPGETEDDFQQTCDFVRQQELSGLHVFPFSPRLGTPAAALPGQVPDAVKRERVQRLLSVDAELRQRFHRSLLGSIRRVLWEQQRDGVWQGYTENYVAATLAAGGAHGVMRHGFSAVRVVEATAEGVRVDFLEDGPSAS